MPSYLHLAVKDLAASMQWYEALGFRKIYAMPVTGTPVLVHMRWIKYADLLLVAETEPAPSRKGVGIAVSFASQMTEIDALHARARKLGVNVINEIGNRPWNTRDFTVTDPDGFTIVFTAGPVEQSLTIETVSARSQKAVGSL